MEIKNKILDIGLNEKLYFGGIPMMINDIEELIAADISLLIPIIILLMVILLVVTMILHHLKRYWIKIGTRLPALL